MTETSEWWHAYGGLVDEMYCVIITGPSPIEADGVNSTGKSIKDIEAVSGVKYLTTFDHEPTDLEKDHLQPEEFWTWDENGDEIPWEE